MATGGKGGREGVSRAEYFQVTKVRTVEHIVRRLLAAACADVEVGVRAAIIEALQRSPALDPFLSQPDWCASPHSPFSVRL